MSKLESAEPDSSSSSDNESGGDDREHVPETIYLPNEEPKQYYLAIRREIEENENYDINEAIIMLEEVMKIIRLSSDSNTEEVSQHSLSKEHHDYFMEEGLALILRELLVSRRFPEVGKGVYDIVIRVNEFFQRVLEFMIWSITNDGNLSLLDNLRRIFDDERFFYMQTSMLESERDEEEEKLPTFAVMPKPREFPRYGPHVPSMMVSHYSPFLIQNINFFGRKGGFNAMLDRINKLDPKVNFQRLKLFVRIFAQLRDFLTNEVKDDIAPKLFSAISSYMLTLKDDELRPLDRLEIEDLNRFLSMFIEKVPSMEGRAYEMLEKLTLDFSLKCFKSSLLDKQLNGLANIEEMVELALNRERMGFMSQMEEYSHQMHSFYRTSRWVTVSYMIEWICNHKIIEELFINNPHLELIKRCAKLLQMLGQKGALKSEHLDAIWNATVNKHETIINATLEVISEACTMLNEQQLKYLLDKIAALSLKEYTERTLTLLVDFAKTMDFDIKNRALDMLWFLIIDENAHTVKLDVQIQALKKFGKLLGFYQFRNRRNELMQKFIDTIKTGNSVLQSIHLLQCVIDTFSERESDMSMPSFYEESKKAVIIRLEKEAG